MIIDIHGHVTSPALLAKYPMPPSLGDVEGMLDEKARLGIGLTIVGTPVGAGTMSRIPGHDNYAQSLDELRAHHDWLAETVRAHPGRLLAYAYTNPFGGDAMLADAQKNVREGGFVGLMVNTSVKGEYLDSERAADFWAMAAELDIPVFLHPPAEPVGSGAVQDFRLVEQIARYNDVTLAVSAIIFAGVLERHPDLRLIAATAGGALSLIAGRLDTAFRPRHWGAGGPPGGGPPAFMRFENKISEAPTTFLDRVYVDTANWNRHNLGANVDVLGADHVLFGTDAPPLATPLQSCIEMVEGLGLPEQDEQKIFHRNAERLFGLGNGEGV